MVMIGLPCVDSSADRHATSCASLFGHCQLLKVSRHLLSVIICELFHKLILMQLDMNVVRAGGYEVAQIGF